MGVSEGDCIQRMYILDAAGRQYRLIKIAKKNGSCKGKTTRCSLVVEQLSLRNLDPRLLAARKMRISSSPTHSRISTALGL